MVAALTTIFYYIHSIFLALILAHSGLKAYNGYRQVRPAAKFYLKGRKMTSPETTLLGQDSPTRRGRHSIPHRTAWGEEVLGLYRIPGSRHRWRIVATGQRFTEVDERRAVQRFRDWQAQHHPTNVNVPTKIADKLVLDPASGLVTTIIQRTLTQGKDFWPWLRKLLVDQPEYVARMTGLPEVAGLRHLNIPGEPLKLSALLDAYTIHNSAKPATKAATRRTWEHFVNQTAAVTLDDLTIERLLAYRATTEADPLSPRTRKFYYSKIKTVLAFGLKVGMDTGQIRRALDRCKVLWTAERTPAPKPAPISREDFHALLKATETRPWQVWRPWLLLGLNLCMHIGEVCELTWDELNLDAGTYCSIRKKTEAHRIPRAATLWPETLEALAVVRHKSPYVFTSQHGTKYGRSRRCNTFADFRKAAGVGDDVTFDCLRDGAYTAAMHGAPDERWARLLAGHRSPGLQDSYVLRNPEIVRPACDAVYKVYGPFPAPSVKSMPPTTNPPRKRKRTNSQRSMIQANVSVKGKSKAT